jgi:hypothetical protein
VLSFYFCEKDDRISSFYSICTFYGCIYYEFGIDGMDKAAEVKVNDTQKLPKPTVYALRTSLVLYLKIHGELDLTIDK